MLTTLPVLDRYAGAGRGLDAKLDATAKETDPGIRPRRGPRAELARRAGTLAGVSQNRSPDETAGGRRRPKRIDHKPHREHYDRDRDQDRRRFQGPDEHDHAANVADGVLTFKPPEAKEAAPRRVEVS